MTEELETKRDEANGFYHEVMVRVGSDGKTQEWVSSQTVVFESKKEEKGRYLLNFIEGLPAGLDAHKVMIVCSSNYASRHTGGEINVSAYKVDGEAHIRIVAENNNNSLTDSPVTILARWWVDS